MSLKSNFEGDVLKKFFLQVQKNPKAIAAQHDNTVYTYDELGKRVNTIAAALANSGVTHRSVVALAIDHDINLIAAPLAVLKLGAAYLPIDKRLPVARLNFMLLDAQPVLLLATADFLEQLAQNSIPTLDIAALSTENPDGVDEYLLSRPDDVAYIIYTSGSTGNPKGVVVSRGNLANYCAWASSKYFDSVQDRIALYSTLSFDFTATCIFPPLMCGCSIAIYDGVNNAFVLKDILENNQSQIIKITPAYLEVLAELVEQNTVIKRLIVGGEDLKTSLAAKVTERIPGVEIVNEYGPTEATVGCMNHIYSAQDNSESSVPIGKAIDGVQIQLIGDVSESMASNSGEIVIFGDSVATKYLNNDEANRAQFISLPNFPNHRCYKTGDFARRNSNGDLIFVGRRDAQVKILGNRVELGEVEATFSRMSFISKVHVTHRNYLSTNEIVAAIVLKEAVHKEKIISEYAKTMPAYTVPATILFMENLPTTANQKIDTNAILMEIKEQRNAYAS